MIQKHKPRVFACLCIIYVFSVCICWVHAYIGWMIVYDVILIYQVVHIATSTLSWETGTCSVSQSTVCILYHSKWGIYVIKGYTGSVSWGIGYTWCHSKKDTFFCDSFVYVQILYWLYKKYLGVNILLYLNDRNRNKLI